MKKIIFTILIILSFIPFAVKAREINLEWKIEYYNKFSDVYITNDGGIVAVATESKNEQGEYEHSTFIFKYDKDGNLSWKKEYEEMNYISYLNCIVEDKDGNYIVGGFDEYYEETSHSVLLKYDKNGTFLWKKTYKKSSIEDILVTDNNDYIVAGYSKFIETQNIESNGYIDAMILRYDKDGNLLFEKNFGGSKMDLFYSIIITEDNGLVAAGRTESTKINELKNLGKINGVIVKFDENMNEEWSRIWGGSHWDEFKRVSEENGFLVVNATTNSTDINNITYIDGIKDAIIKYDKNGNLIENFFVQNETNVEYSVIKKTNNEYIINVTEGFENIEGLTKKETTQNMILKCSIEYDLENFTDENGDITVVQQGSKAIITPTPDKGYEVDAIIVKDKEGNVLDIEIISNPDGTYLFELYTDVSVEVTFKEKIENPKTGILDVITILFTGMIISLVGFFLVKNYNERYEM